MLQPRRTKEQVARDLRVKTEQTLFCALDAAQRRLYDELRHHYWASLLGRIGRDGIGRGHKALVFSQLTSLLDIDSRAPIGRLIDRGNV